jgi:hypothetical protein
VCAGGAVHAENLQLDAPVLGMRRRGGKGKQEEQQRERGWGPASKGK